MNRPPRRRPAVPAAARPAVRPAAGGAVLGLLLALAALLTAAPAAAHPLGNFTVSHHDALVVAPDRLRVHHVEDLAEIPAAQAGADIDTDGDGTHTARELAAWAAPRCAAAAGRATVRRDGAALPLTVDRAGAERRPGQAGLPTLRVECRLSAALRDLTAGTEITFTSAAGTGADAAWREITARGDRVTLERSDVPERSASAVLTSYPEDLLSSPPDRRGAALTVRPGGAPLAGDGDGEAAGPAGVLPRGADRFTEAFTGLVAGHRLTPAFAAVALGVAVALGAMHALAPGHGKTVMAAAAAGRGRGSRRDVLRLGVTVTVTHTAGVLVLGAVVVGGSTAVPAALPWLGAASGALVAAAGAGLLRRAWRDRERGHGHTHAHHHHTHTHTHDPAPAPRRRGAVLMGFAGGLVPSPSAVLVLVGAWALGKAWFGALLVLAYGAGLALTLVAIGLLVVHAGQRLARLAAAAPRRKGGRLLHRMQHAAPVGTAAAVLVLGCTLALRGMSAAVG
ncbi:hypothetical protein GCM10027168_62260 [Streptomyces capparidis]